MTIGGALSDLNNLLKADDIPLYYKPLIKAVMDTIALTNSEIPTSSTTKNNLVVDAISRQQAIDAFPDLLPNIGYNKKAITEILQKVPPVTPQEPKKGHWLMPDKEYSIKIWRKCSCCGTHIEKFSKYISFDGEAHYIPYRLNYCYVCGAKMANEKQEE